MLLTNCFAVCSARLIFIFLMCIQLPCLIIGFGWKLIKRLDFMVHNMECQCNNVFSTLKSLYLQLFFKYYSQLCLTLFEVVFRRTSGPSITPSVIPQTLTDELLSVGLGSSHQGQELYPRVFQCRAHLRLLRTVVLLDFYLNRVGVQLLEVQPPNTCSARHIPQPFK